MELYAVITQFKNLVKSRLTEALENVNYSQ